MFKKIKDWFYYNIVERGQYCTCWFDGWFGKYWGDCCKDHDYHYMNQDKHDKTKSEVDNNLFKCVRKKVVY
jgi:aspartate aminotransferase-like enzyme